MYPWPEFKLSQPLQAESNKTKIMNIYNNSVTTKTEC